MKGISIVGHIAARIGLSERRKDTRVCARELNASYAAGAREERAKVKNISATGAYLLTDHRWLVGTRLLLTLQRRSLRHRASVSQMRLRAKVVRLGKDGVGVSFVDEQDDTPQWLSLVPKATSLAPEDGAVRVFCIAKVLAFLLRISPSAEESIVDLLRNILNDERIERALEIVLSAEEMLAFSDFALKGTVPPGLLLRILVDGSKSNDESMRESWAGLLATCSLEGSNDSENASLAALLSKLEPVHLHILVAAGQRTVHAGLQSESVTFQELHCTMQEIKRITQTRNVTVIECALNRLYEFRLLELTIKPFGCASLDHANLTPTKLGFSLYRACSGPQRPPEVLDAGAVEVAS